VFLQTLCCFFPWPPLSSQDSQQEVLRLDKLQQQHGGEQLYKLQGEGARSFALGLLCWALPAGGARVWWLLPKVHSSLGLLCEHGRYAPWAQHGWRRWPAFIQELGLPRCHLRSTAMCQWHDGAGQQEAGEAEPGAAAMERAVDEDQDTAWTQRSVSTHALIALLARFSAPRGRERLQQEHDREQCRLLLCALLSHMTSVHREYDMALYLREDRWEPPAQPTGVEPITLTVVDGCMQVAPLLQVGARMREAVLAALEGVRAAAGGGVPLACVLRGFASAPRLRHLFRQLVVRLGCKCDQVAASEAELLTPPPGAKMTDSQRETQLARYLRAHRELMKEAAQVSIVMDAGRVGGRGIVHGSLSTPEGHGFLYPPQAPPAASPS